MKAPNTSTVRPSSNTVNDEDRSANPSVYDYATVIAVSGIVRSSGNSISTVDPLRIGNSDPT